MEGQCESKLLIPNTMDVSECSLLEGHEGFHQESGTIPPYLDDEDPDDITSDPTVRWMIVWWEMDK